jgi:general stress protein CsbA
MTLLTAPTRHTFARWAATWAGVLLFMVVVAAVGQMYIAGWVVIGLVVVGLCIPDLIHTKGGQS